MQSDMKKKIMLILTCVLMLLLAACGGADPKTVDYNGYTYEELQHACVANAEALESLNLEELEKAIEASPDDAPAALKAWVEIRPELGEYLGLGEFKITRAGKTLIAEQTINYENRPVLLTNVYNYRDMSIEDTTVDRIYTTGERMKRAGLNSVMCIAIVFAVLIIISLLIYAFKLFAVAGQKKAEEKNEQKEDTAGTETVQEDTQDKKKLFALAAAAVAAYSGNSTDAFHVTSVQKTEDKQ